MFLPGSPSISGDPGPHRATVVPARFSGAQCRRAYSWETVNA